MKKLLVSIFAILALCATAGAQTRSQNIDTSVKDVTGANKGFNGLAPLSILSAGVVDLEGNLVFKGNTSGGLVFEGATKDAFETTFTITDPTADRTITFPNDTGTVALNPLAGTLTFEGATVDAFETVINVVDPTADGNYYLPDLGVGLADLNVSFVVSTINSGLNAPGLGTAVWMTANGVVGEGTTADAFEQTWAFPDATVGDATISFPDTAGVNDTVAMVTLAQTLASKTLTAPVINGATSSGSTAINLSGNTGAFTMPTNDATLPPDSTGGNLGAANTLTGIVNSKLISFGTMTDGTAAVKTKALMDDTPAGEFAQVGGTADPTITNDASFARKGTNSLKLAFTAPSVAGDGVEWTAFGAENWEAQESMGFWIYSTMALSAGDIVITLVESTGDVPFNLPAVAVANKWTWVEVDISSLTGGTGDAVTNYQITLSTAGAALGAFDLYVDGAFKWDATEELTLGVDLVDSPGAVRSVFALVKANTGTHDFVSLTEDTDFFVHSESGNDFLVTITDQSANAALALVNHK